MKRTLFIGCLLLAFVGTGIAQQTGTITGDKVRVRTKPTTTNSETVGYVNKGDKVTILDKTSKQEKIGSMEDYWYKIEFDGSKQGWTFGHFVKIVSAENKGSSTLEIYKEFLKGLDNTNIASIAIAKEKYRDIFKNSDENAEEGFRIFRIYYTGTVRKASYRSLFKNKDLQKALNDIGKTVNEGREDPLDKLSGSKDFKDIKKTYKNEIQILYEYKSNGIRYSCGEGTWYFIEDNEYIVKEVLDGFSFDLKNYIYFLAKEMKYTIGQDAGYSITWDELRQRIIRWEQFSQKYPELEEVKREVIPKTKTMMGHYLIGIDNTRIYEWGKTELKQDLRNSYHNFIKENTESKYHELVSKIYQMYLDSNFEISDEIINYIRTSGFRFNNHLLPKQKK